MSLHSGDYKGIAASIVDFVKAHPVLSATTISFVVGLLFAVIVF